MDVGALWTKARGRSPVDLGRVARRRLKADSDSIGLRRDLAREFRAPDADVPITVRPLGESDLVPLFGPPHQGRDEPDSEFRERRSRLRMHTDGLTTCYVAVTDEGEPCYAQWLLGPEQNDKVQAHFSGTYPRVEPGEVLLEGAYTPPAFRGRRIMPAAMARIAEQGGHQGARWVLTFVGEENVPSLKGCWRAGFEPYVRRHESWRGFVHRVTFQDLPEGYTLPFAEASREVGARGGPGRGSSSA